MRYQISFERAGKVHWVFCEQKDTAEELVASLDLAGNHHIEILQDPNTDHARWLIVDRNRKRNVILRERPAGT